MADDIVKVKIDTDTKDSVKSVIKYTAAIGGAVLAINKVLNTSKEMVNAYRVQEQAERKLQAVVKATGGAAGLTSQEMINLARSLQKVTTFGDEAIIGAEAILGTFKNVKNEAFIRTTEAALDMATVLGTDLNSAMVQLGKAVNDPVLGVTALNRAGIQFTDTQKDTIKNLVESNQLYEAQNIVLKEVEGQLGGVAKSMADTSTGSLDQFVNIWGDLYEVIGEVIVERIQPFVKWMTSATTALIDFINKQRVSVLTSDIEDLNEEISRLEKGMTTRSRSGTSIVGMNMESETADISTLKKELSELIAKKDELSGVSAPAMPEGGLEGELSKRTALNEAEAEGLTIWERKAALAQMDSEASVAFYENEKEIAEKGMALKEEEAAFEEEMFQKRLEAASTFFNGWAALAELGADKSEALAIAFKALSSAEALIASYTAFDKVLGSSIPFPFNVAAASGVLAKGIAMQAKILGTPIPKHAMGTDFVTSGPQMIMVGDNATGRERVTVNPIGNDSGSGEQVLIVPLTIDGNEIGRVMTRLSADGRMITSSRSVR